MIPNSFFDELSKIAEANQELAPYLKQVQDEKPRYNTPAQSKIMKGSLIGGAGVGALGGAALGAMAGKSIPGKVFKAVGAAIPGTLIGGFAGGIGGAVAKGNPKGRFYTPQEQRASAIQSYLMDYSDRMAIDDKHADPWEDPSKLSPAQRAEFRKVQALEKEYTKTMGVSPW